MGQEQAPRLVGRTRELELVDETLTRATEGLAVLVLRGEPGVGTTRLLDEACARAGGRGMRVVRVGTSPLESEIGYAVLLGLVRPLVLGAPPGARAALVEDLSDLATVVPALGPAPEPAGEPDLLRLRVGEAVRELLARATRGGPLLLAVDDAEDADPASLATLLHVLRGPDALHLALVVTAHGGRAETFVRALRAVPGTEVHDVPPLQPEDGRRLLAALLGEDPPEDVARGVLDRAQGSPVLVRALTGSLLASGALRREHGRWSLPDGEQAEPPELAALVQRRLDRLDPASHRAVGLLALAGGRLEHVALVRALRELDPDRDPEDTVADVAATSLVTDETTSRLTYRLTHPVLATTAAARHSPVERRRMHASLARALADSEDADRPALQATLAGDHLDDHSALGLLLPALRGALRRGAGEAAGRFAEAGLQRSPEADGPVHGELLRGRALGLELAGRADDAVAAWEQVVDRAGSREPSAVVEAVHHLVRLDAEGGRSEQAVERVRRLTREPVWGRLEPAERIPVLDLAAGVALRLGSQDDDLLALLTEAATAVGSTAARQRALLRQAQVHIERGDLVSLARLLDEIEPDDPEVLRARALGGLEWGDPREAVDLLRAGLAQHRDDTPPLVDLRLRGALGLALLRCERFDEARAEAGTVELMGGRLGSGRAVSYACIVRGIVGVRRGDVAAARSELAAARAAYPGLTGADLHLARYADHLQGLLDVVSGRPDAVVDRARRRGVLGRAGGVQFVRASNLVLAEALVRTADLVTLRRLADVLLSRTPDHPVARSLADRVAGWAAREDGDLAAAATLLAGAARSLAALDLKGEAASAWLDWAEVTEPEQAAPVVHDALPSLETLGLTPEVRRARRLLRRTTVTAPRRRSGDLTQRELEIARLVADGLTDGEIARRLVVSPRTVTTHLQHAYRRLGLTGRTALARHVLEQPDT